MSGSSVATQGADVRPLIRGSRLPAARKVARDREIVVDRHKGLSWPIIAQRHGLQERQCRAIYAQWRDSDKDPIRGLDPTEWLRETLCRYESLIGSLALIGESGDNDAARVGALRAQMQAMLHQSQLLIASGLMPRDLAFHVHDERGQVIEMVNRMVAVLERHDLNPSVLDDLEQAITDEAPLSPVGLQRRNTPA